MTKQEAIEAMQRGEKVTHHLFSPSEWMTVTDFYGYDRYTFEDGTVCIPFIFWRSRTQESWDDGYSIFKEPIP